jgi:hypothetical protein
MPDPLSASPVAARQAAFLFLKPANAIPQPGRVFVILAVDRMLQLFPQLNQLGLSLFILRQAPRTFAAVPRFPMDIFQKRGELLAEFLIIVGTAQASGISELHEFDAAVWAFALVERA